MSVILLVWVEDANNVENFSILVYAWGSNRNSLESGLGNKAENSLYLCFSHFIYELERINKSIEDDFSEAFIPVTRGEKNTHSAHYFVKHWIDAGLFGLASFHKRLSWALQPAKEELEEQTFIHV